MGCFCKVTCTVSALQVKCFVCVCACVCWSNLIHSRLYVCSASLKKFCSLIPSLTLSMEKEVIVLEKVWKKPWSLDPKICTTPVLTQPVAYFSGWWYCKILLKYFVLWEEVSQLTNASVYHCTVILLATFCVFSSSV